jgi:hypothetical protein
MRWIHWIVFSQEIGPPRKWMRPSLCREGSRQGPLPEEFRFRTEKYEFVDDIPAFDLLTGAAVARERIPSGDDPPSDRRARLCHQRRGACGRRGSAGGAPLLSFY